VCVCVLCVCVCVCVCMGSGQRRHCSHDSSLRAAHLPHNDRLHGWVLPQQLTQHVGSVTCQLAAGVSQLVDQRCQQCSLSLWLGRQQPAERSRCLFLDKIKVGGAVQGVGVGGELSEMQVQVKK
jgi:hypothetical protein